MLEKKSHFGSKKEYKKKEIEKEKVAILKENFTKWQGVTPKGLVRQKYSHFMTKSKYFGDEK